MHTIIPDQQAPDGMPRGLHEICQDARRGQCDYCCAMPGEPCAFGLGTGPDGYHVARFTWARAHDLISVLDVGAVLWAVAAAPFTEITVIYDPGVTVPDEGQADEDLDDLEPYCATCGADVGIFIGHGEAWLHYTGQGTAADPVELFDAGHAPEVAWRPAGAVSGEDGA